MSFVVTGPESMAAAAGDLANIGSSLHEATATAAGRTTGVTAAAADEVSVAISELFASYGREFHGAVARAAAVNSAFVSLLNGGAQAYLSTEIANAEQALLDAAPGVLPHGSTAATAITGDAYLQLIAHTSTNLQSLFGTWAADPFPLLRQFIANQYGYWQQISAAISYAIQNLPAELASLPAAIQATVYEVLTFPYAAYLQNLISTQVGFAQLFAASLDGVISGVVSGLPAFTNELGLALQAWLTGNYFGAVQDVAQAFANLFVTGFTTSSEFAYVTGINPQNPLASNPILYLGANGEPLGPLADLITIASIPGLEAQNFTNLLPTGSIPRQMSQNFTNILVALTNPSVQVDAVVPLLAPAAVQYSAYFGLPLVFTYALLGPPISTLNALAASATAFQQAVSTGNLIGAVNVVVDAPAVALDGFLNGETIVDETILIPTGLSPIVIPIPPPPPPFPPFPPIVIDLPATASFTFHLPFDGILVPPHQIQATFDLPGYTWFGAPLPGFPVTETVGGTPFSGLVPLLVNYIPEELAALIKNP